MKKFIINIFIISIALFVVFYAFDKTITLGLRQSNMLIYDNLTKLFNGKINADLIINGSSKAYVQLSPRIIDSTLALNSYNLGLDGTPFIPQKVQYELYERYNTPPKIIIQIVDFSNMAKAQGNLYNYSKFAPYINIDIVRQMTKLYNGFTFIDYHVPLLRYSGMPIEVLDGILSLFNLHIAPSNLYKGYLEQDIPWDGTFEKFKESYKRGVESKLDTTTCKLFEDYIKRCKEKNIQLFLVYPPLFYESIPYDINRKTMLDYFNKVSLKYSVPFLDYSYDELSFNKGNFYNSQHLNKIGAELFTKKLCIDIKERNHKDAYKKISKQK
jgi:hypothetical protein